MYQCNTSPSSCLMLPSTCQRTIRRKSRTLQNPPGEHEPHFSIPSLHIVTVKSHQSPLESRLVSVLAKAQWYQHTSLLLEHPSYTTLLHRLFSYSPWKLVQNSTAWSLKTTGLPAHPTFLFWCTGFIRLANFWQGHFQTKLSESFDYIALFVFWVVAFPSVSTCYCVFLVVRLLWLLSASTHPTPASSGRS